MKTYKVSLEEYHNSDGKVSNKHYLIKEQKFFLFIFPYWTPIKKRDMFGDTEHKKFKTIEAAEDYIANVLYLEKPRQSWTSTDLKKIQIPD